MTDDDSVDSDEWGAEELVIPSVTQKVCVDMNDEDEKNNVDDDYWELEKNVEEKPNINHQQQDATKDGESMIIVDVTQLDPNIHSKFDRNSVNQPEQASSLRKKIEENYKDYAFSPKLLSEGAIIPCGSTVWKDALVRLRDDRPGHYFVPIFAPKTKTMK